MTIVKNYAVISKIPVVLFIHFLLVNISKFSAVIGQF